MILGKNFKPVLLLPIVAAVILGSCASKPPAPAPEPVPVVQPPAPEPTPPPPEEPKVSQAELDDLLAQVKTLKKKAFDLKLFEVLPDDYKAADGAYAAGLSSYEGASKDPKQGLQAKADLEKARSAYEELIAKGVVDLAKAKRADADAMKATSLKAGADTKAQERFVAADEAYAAASALLDQGKHEEAIGVFERARLYYELAYKKATAGDLRSRIVENDYAKWDSGNYQLADNKYSAEEGVWASGDAAQRTSGIDMLDEAILRFNLVVQKGRQSVATVAKEKTDDSKAKSEQIKAQVAVKDQYQAALKTYEGAVAALASGDYETATQAFAEAQVAFDQAYETAADKRAKAKAAMEAAEAAAADSARKADEAESLVGPTAQ